MRRRHLWAVAGLLAVLSSWTYFFPRPPRLGPLSQLEPSRSSPMLIFVPHSDDEVLAAGGLIQQMTAAGSPPQVVLVTGGDGFKLGAEARYKGRATPSVMMDYARHRLGESRDALTRLGLPADKFTFLGFPDQGLHRLWLECWSAKPCTSATTQASQVPYSEAWRPAAPYTGEALEGQIRDLLRAARPAVVVYPHPNEAHVDHWALSNFVEAALEDLRRTEPDWTPPEEWFYLVHRGDWPAPKGYRPQDPLLPPASMAGGMTTWHERALTPEQVQTKDQALLAYQSQVALMKRYLTSFVRTNELFGTIDRVRLPAPLLLPGQAPLDGPPWRDLAWTEAITDPRADTMARGVERGADSSGVWAARDGNTLWLASRMGARPRPPVEVRFYARGYHTGMGWGDLAGLVVFPDGSHSVEAWPSQTGQTRREDVVAGVESTWVRVGIPLAVLGNPETVMINVETRVEGVLVDRTAWRPVSLDER